MRHIKNGAWVCVLGLAAAGAAGGAAAPVEHSFAERVEMVDWSDPERAAQLIDAVPTPAERRAPEIQMLEVRGMVLADVHRDLDVDATITRLQMLSHQGDKSAAVAEHYLRAYSLYQRDQYSAADTELKRIDIESIASPAERYRVSILHGNTLRMLGKAEAALPFLERGLDLAHEMHDEARSLHAMLWLARIYTNTGNFDRASAQLETARRLGV